MFDLFHHTMYNPCAILYITQMKRLIATKRTKSCEKGKHINAECKPLRRRAIRPEAIKRSATKIRYL